MMVGSESFENSKLKSFGNYVTMTLGCGCVHEQETTCIFRWWLSWRNRCFLHVLLSCCVCTGLYSIIRENKKILANAFRQRNRYPLRSTPLVVRPWNKYLGMFKSRIEYLDLKVVFTSSAKADWMFQKKRCKQSRIQKESGHDFRQQHRWRPYYIKLLNSSINSR